MLCCGLPYAGAGAVSSREWRWSGVESAVEISRRARGPLAGGHAALSRLRCVRVFVVLCGLVTSRVTYGDVAYSLAFLIY